MASWNDLLNEYMRQPDHKKAAWMDQKRHVIRDLDWWQQTRLAGV